MGAFRMIRHQVRYELLTFFRNRQSLFFAVILPVMFLAIFVATFGNDTTMVRGHLIKLSTYYVPSLAAMGVVSATFVNLSVSITLQRESGILKRRRATPVAAWMLIAGHSVTALLVSGLIVVLLILVGRIFYGVHVPKETLGAVALTTAVGSVAFCALGYAFASFVQSYDSAVPFVQAIVLPLYFFSGVFIPYHQVPSVLQHIANVFPVRHLAQAFLDSFDPSTSGTRIAGEDLAIISAWGVSGLLIALRRFTWTPRGG